MLASENQTSYLTPGPPNMQNGMATPKPQPAHVEHVWVVTGPAGCGKSTVAQHLAHKLSLPYIEGDDFHSPSNKEKMGANIPLTDSDRWDWLVLLRKEAARRLTKADGVVVTCSALKEKYRDEFRVLRGVYPSVRIHFIFLDAPEAILQQRVAARKGHYMKTEMVRSQFESLEAPREGEWDIHKVDVGVPESEVCANAMKLVNAIMIGSVEPHT